jgi:N-acetylglucosaminyldiphosphoundecaprenol N-acetyl-beta-D-mannosaminyltransferase
MSSEMLTVESSEPTQGSPSRMNILGVGVSVINMDDAIGRCDQLIRSNGHGYVCATDVHTVTEALSDSAFRAILNGSFMTTPDGMPLVWMGRLQGHKRMRRVYGPDLLIELCRFSEQRGFRHFFYGGKPGVADQLGARLKARFPDLNVVGTCTPPFRPLTAGEEKQLIAFVEQTKPDVFWVGLGSPKQERFMAQYCGKLNCRLMVGVGAAFDFHSGAVKETPRWVRDIGMQWFHRLLQEPGRLGQRYIKCIPAFLWNVGLQFAGLRRFSHES